MHRDPEPGPPSRSSQSKSSEPDFAGSNPPTVANASRRIRAVHGSTPPRSPYTRSGTSQLGIASIPSRNGSWRTITTATSGCSSRYASCRSSLLGSHTSSWSQNASNDPDAVAAPMFRAVATPAAEGRSTNSPRGNHARQSVATATLPSSEPSSTAMSSSSEWLCCRDRGQRVVEERFAVVHGNHHADERHARQSARRSARCGSARLSRCCRAGFPGTRGRR